MNVFSRYQYMVKTATYSLQFLIVFCCFMLPTIESYCQQISKEKAIRIAQRHGYYNTSGNWRTPSVIFDSTQYQWQIISVKYSHVSEGNCSLEKQVKPACNCKNTNGCTDILTKEIRLSARNGKVIKKRISRKRYPNYE